MSNSGISQRQDSGGQAQFSALLQLIASIDATLKNASGSAFAVSPQTGVSPYNITASAGVISVRPAVPAPSVVNVPASGPFLVADGAGNASVNNITINPPAGYTIIGAPSYTISADWGSVWLVLDGTNFLTLP